MSSPDQERDPAVVLAASLAVILATRLAARRTLAQLARARMAKTWVTQRDNKVRDLHVELDGMTLPLDQEFVTSDGFALMYPGDSSAPPHLTANCRCVLIGGQLS